MINNLRLKKQKVTSGTKEWADYNVNCINGCHNNCRYCYAKMIAKRFKRTTEDSWKNMSVRKSAVTKNYHKFSGRVMFPSSHDIFTFPEVEEAIFTVLSKLLKNQNNVLIATKPRINTIKKIDAMFSDFKENIQFRFTITSRNNDLLKFWEPNAPNFEERTKSLRLAFERGYKTSVSIEPFLDFNPIPLVRLVEPFTTESIWLGIMNYIPRKNILANEKKYYEKIRRNYEIENLWKIFYQLKDYPIIKFKDSIKTRLKLQ